MHTEITDSADAKGWVLFDGQCRLCTALAQRFGSLLHRHRFALEPLQTRWVRERLGMAEDELLSEIRLLTPDGKIYGGADALLAIARHIWWARPLYLLARIPRVKAALDQAYRYVARRRNCLGGDCHITGRAERREIGWWKWGPAIALPVSAVAWGQNLVGWAWMWVLVLALFMGAKWVTAYPLLFPKGAAGRGRLLPYLLLWPGLDAEAFFRRNPIPKPPTREWLVGSAKALFGAGLLWVGLPLLPPTHPLLTGWLGMIGVVFLLHFGCFHLLSLLWRQVGIDARPIMQSPGKATSLSQFWGRSWNAAFTDLMHEHLFRPLARNHGARIALLTVFLISGVLHELVISLPARGGYGLPTIYFVLQGLGLLFEHSKPGRELGIGSGWKGWCFVALVTGLPAFGLFHPVFIHNVILPMLHVIGAT